MSDPDTIGAADPPDAGGHSVVFLAGESAERSWRFVAPLLRDGTRVVFHELQGNTRTDPDFRWTDEVASLGAAVPPGEAAHLVGFSGGATLALAFVAVAPERVASLALVEPAWSYLPLSPLEAAYRADMEAVIRLPAAAQREAFRRLIVGDAASKARPRPDLVAAEIAREAAGLPTSLRVLTEAMAAHHVDPAAFGRYEGRALTAIGGRSHPMWRDQAASLAAAFGHARVDRYPDRHHLDPPQRSEVDRFLAGLRWAWAPPASG